MLCSFGLNFPIGVMPFQNFSMLLHCCHLLAHKNWLVCLLLTACWMMWPAGSNRSCWIEVRELSDHLSDNPYFGCIQYGLWGTVELWVIGYILLPTNSGNEWHYVLWQSMGLHSYGLLQSLLYLVWSDAEKGGVTWCEIIRQWLPSHFDHLPQHSPQPTWWCGQRILLCVTDGEGLVSCRQRYYNEVSPPRTGLLDANSEFWTLRGVSH